MGDVERRFATSFREADTDEPGLVLEDDGTIWRVKPDGTRVELTENGGSQAGAVRWLGPCKTNAWAAQNFTSAGVPTGGTFKLSLGADQTAAIAFDATPAQVIAALEALPSVGTANVGANPRIAGGPDISSGYSVQFKDLTATEMLTADGTDLTGPDAPYAVNFGTDNQMIEMFTPTAGDIIEDFMHVVTEDFQGTPTLNYTDSVAHPDANTSGSWSNPTSDQGVAGLELDFDELNDFTNFSGLRSNPGVTGQPTSLLALIANWTVTSGTDLYTNLPAMVRNAVPIYSYLKGIDNAPIQGELWIWVKVSTPAALMD